MTVQVIITFQDNKEVLGKLYVYDDNDNVIFTCDILGLPDKIAAGTYTCTWDFMNDLQEPHYLINDVPNHTRVFFHELNTYLQTLACIGLGNGLGEINGDGEQDILNSRKTVAAFEALMAKQPFEATFIYSPAQTA